MVAGVVLVLLLALSTCELDFGNNANQPVEYTDVWYSEDGTMITLYLDGVGIPVSESNRALNRDMAKFSYNYLEAVFVSSDAVARARWSIGQTAGIRGVPRGTGNTAGEGIDYGNVFVDDPGEPGSGNAATIFVGRDDGTLLGVGSICWVDDPRGTSDMSSEIYPITVSVTFLVSAFYTSLAKDSFPTGITSGSVGDGPVGTFVTASGASANGTGADRVFSGPSPVNTIVNLSAIDGTNYPLYYLPNNAKTIQASYTIFADALDDTDRMALTTSVGPLSQSALATGASDERPNSVTSALNTAIRLADVASVDEQVLLRIPSYQSAGRVRELVESYYYRILARMTNNGGGGEVDGSEFNPIITFEFETTKQAGSEGVFGFGFDIPVYAITDANSTNGAAGAYDWYVRSSFGQARYLLDDGEGAGGLVLMGVDVTATDWLELYFKWR